MTELVLGWEVTPAGDPVYWLSSAAASGGQRPRDLVTVAASKMSAHTVIVAQSGSGKSTFVSRLIEELLIRTKARCVIFDPNADFWKADDVEDASMWEHASYDQVERRGRLPHEGRRKQFAGPWSRVGVRILAAQQVGSRPKKPYERLEVWWPSVSVEAFAEGLSPVTRSEVYQCHAFVQAIADLNPRSEKGKQEDIIDRAERLFNMGKRNTEEFRASMREDFTMPKGPVISLMGLVVPSEFFDIGVPVRRAVDALQYVSDQTGKFYFAKAREYKTAGILATSRETGSREEGREAAFRKERLDVIALPSIDDPDARFLVVDALLADEWKAARAQWRKALEDPPAADERVPTFILVEEAHNMIPTEAPGQQAQARTLRERFRTIAAEGRKYGLFLILVSQRPDKLDPLVVSECENKALMRLDSQEVLRVARRLLGLEAIAPRTLDRCLDFGIGRALLIGRWAPEGRVLYTAARRTVEGGRNLRPEHWALPVPPPRAAPKPKRVKRKRKAPRASRVTATTQP